MTKPILNIGLLGCGEIARAVHVGALARCAGARLRAVADIDPGRRSEAAFRSPGAAVYADYRDLLGAAGVDAVIIALPPALHAEAAEAAFAAGKHVYLEKPLATDLEGGRKALAAWRASGRVGMIGFNSRFNPLYRAAAAFLREGRLGELVAARSCSSGADRPLPEWKRSRRDGGGVLLDLASHHADLVAFLFGRAIEEVFAESRSLASEQDTAAIQMRLEGGLVVQTLVSQRSVDEDRFEVYGRAGKLTVDRRVSFDLEVTEPVPELTRLRVLGRAVASLVRSPNLAGRLGAPHAEPSYAAAFEHFVTAAGGVGAASPDLLDGFRSLEVVLAAEESARAGRPVAIGEDPGESAARA